MKSKNVLIAVVISTTFFLQGCKEDRTCLHGDGTVNSYDLSLDTFSRVSLSGPINLRITQGDEQSITIIAESELYLPLEHKVKNGELIIGYDDVSCFDTDHGVWVNITVPELTEINTEGISNIFSEGELNLERLTINTSGSATVELSGQVTSQKLNADGMINVNNFALLTQKTNINITGSGNINISCSEELDIDVEGSAKITYKGDPTITQKADGSLTLLKLD